jgi:hypothetical protein
MALWLLESSVVELQVRVSHATHGQDSQYSICQGSNLEFAAGIN